MSIPAAFEKPFDLRFYEVDSKWRATPITIFNYLQETAMAHSCSMGRSPAVLKEKGVGWFLTRIHIQIDRYPVWEESVRVRTWASRLQGLFAFREFELVDSKNQKCGAATARWVLMDMNRRRPIRLPEWITQSFGVNHARAIEDAFDDIEPFSEPESSRTFHVRLSDLDSNEHANSASYLDWCLESAPPETLKSFVPVAFEIAFKREARQGDTLTASSCRPGHAPNLQNFVYLHSIRREEDGEVLALARSRWRADGSR